jgi:tetratricopeptide (TPR) repeat protein
MRNLPMLADSLGTAALYASVRGDYPAARQASAEGYQIAAGIGNAWGKSYNLSGIVYLLWLRGDYAEALRASDECLREAEEAGYLAAQVINRATLADVLADLGRLDAARREARLALDWAESRLPGLRYLALATLAQQELHLDQLEAAASLAEVGAAAAADEAVWAGEPVRRVLAELAIARGAPDAVECAQARLRPLREQRMMPFVADALETLARAQQQAGQPQAARASLEEARTLSEALGVRRVLWRALHGLARLARTPAEAAALETAWQRVVDDIAAELPDDGWRGTFRERVRQLTGEA